MGGLATGRCGGHAQASRQAKHCAHKGILMLLSCDKAFQDPCHSETREQKYVQQHIRICTHGVKTGLGQGHHRTIDTQSQLISQSQVRPSQWLAGAGAQTQPMPCSVRTLKPCPWGRVFCPATGEFLGTQALQGQLTVAPHAPVTAGPNSPLSWREGPAIIPQVLVAVSAQTDVSSKKSEIDPSCGRSRGRDEATDSMPSR